MSITVPMQGFGGGVPLNFKIVGNPQPTNPKENTIWLNTDEKITGYYFQEKQPENMQNGEIFIATGTQSPVNFNALKKNGITVYPLKAQQMVSGMLKDIKAKQYQDGKWTDWVFSMDIAAYNWSGMASQDISPNISYSNDTLTFSATQSSNVYKYAGVYHKTPIDLTSYKTLKVTGTFSWSGNGNARLGVSKNASTGDVTQGSAYTTWSSSYTGTKTIDVSNLSGSYYFMMQFRLGTSATGTNKITSIELE